MRVTGLTIEHQRAGCSALARSRDHPPSLPPSRVATASRRAGPDVGPPSRIAGADGARALLNCKAYRRDGRPCLLGCWRASVDSTGHCGAAIDAFELVGGRSLFRSVAA